MSLYRIAVYTVLFLLTAPEVHAQEDALGEGYLVWESPRSGRWRLWSRQLDGTNLRRLSPDEKDRDHFCPHISPDGQQILYLSYPQGRNAYQDHTPGQDVSLHLIQADGSGDRVVVKRARAYFEDRAALWTGPQSFVYIADDGTTRQHNLSNGQDQPLTAERHAKHGWLTNTTLTHATDGRPRFRPYDPTNQTLGPAHQHKGCQPYFSPDGTWGYWMQAAGGPIRRIHLPTGQTGDILAKNDPRLPAGRGYLYFPMFSADQRLLVFGASPDQHDHFKSDYDIFAAPTDPATLEIIGPPVRYTFDKGCDRFPDVFARPWELGYHSGEAPFTVELAAEEGKEKWQWHIDSKGGKRKKKLRHTFKKSGRYTVEARRGDRLLKARVQVLEARPPQPLQAALQNDRTIIVLFDEPIQNDGIKAKLASGARLSSAEISPDGYRLTLHLDRALKGPDQLRLSRVADRAQRRNRMDEQTLAIKPPQWPVHDEGLVFVWHTGSKRQSHPLRPRGQARLSSQQSMRLAKGAYWADGADADLLQRIRASGELTIEAVVTPDHIDQYGPSRIVTFSANANARNFTLGQEGGSLVLRLRTTKTGSNGTSPQVTLCTAEAGKPAHILLSYRPGRLVCYRDGELTLDTDAVQGTLDNWENQHLLMGDEWDGGRDWAGHLEGVALYDRFFSPDQAQAHATEYRTLLLGRPPTRRWTVEAQLISASTPPTLEQILPYRSALIACEYQLLSPGTDIPQRLRVAHWALLDGESTWSPPQPGQAVRLEIEPYAAHPQLESVYMADSLEPDFDIPLYHALGP
ncbi:MAG: hypothetical protein GKR89_17715 [Candidatus Latescibacteria bacterium]|nr:hypothetical protein [Candidatus Latescibacterota bacterium]